MFDFIDTDQQSVQHRPMSQSLFVTLLGNDGTPQDSVQATSNNDNDDDSNNYDGYVHFADIFPSHFSTVSLENERRTLFKRANLIGIITFLAVFIALPSLTYVSLQQRGFMGALFFSAAIFVFFSVCLSIHQIIMHLTHWFMPDVQKYVVRILWMVPIYSINSWFSLRFHKAVIFLDLVRGLYEAYVIATFVYYLIELLGGEENLERILRMKSASYGNHARCLHALGCTRWRMGREFLVKSKQGVLQYVVMKSAATVLVVAMNIAGIYSFDKTHFNLSSAKLYLDIVMNISVSWALYCLVKIFYATKEELRHPIDWKPAGKFLCVKGVVFWTFWQGVLMQILNALGVIKPWGIYNSEYVATSLQNYLVCIEMLGFSIAHHYTFTHKEYRPMHEGQDLFETLLLEDACDDSSYMAPNIRQLSTPMSFSQAFWSSSVPSDLICDIRRYSRGTDSIIVNSLTL